MSIALLIAQLSAAQLPAVSPTAPPSAPERRVEYSQVRTSSVTGTVHDSIAGRPLAGATVQLVAADTLARFGQTVISDSLGFFRFREVPEGQYTIGFFHPMLDSLGVEPRLRSVTVNGARSVAANLAIPSATSLSAAVCGAPANGQRNPALLIGIVRDARSREAVSGVTVAGEWMEISLSSTKMLRNSARRVATTRENGWFAICNVPSPGTITLHASRDADSTDVVEVEVPSDGFLRRALFLGSTRTTMVNEPFPRTGAPSAVRAVHMGTNQLTGTIRAANDRRPLANAQVSITNGPTTRTNERGEWTLADAPAGTRSLEVRAVGFYPERRAVDVVDGAPAINLTLATFKSVLDTMKVIANYDRYSNLAGFRERRRSGMGYYLAPEDIARRMPTMTSDLFMSVRGVYLEYMLAADGDSSVANRLRTDPGSANEKALLMRGFTSERCLPTIYINGLLMPNISASELDGFVRPGVIQGIEVYTASQAPPQFQQGMSGCGSILFWM